MLGQDSASALLWGRALVLGLLFGLLLCQSRLKWRRFHVTGGTLVLAGGLLNTLEFAIRGFVTDYLAVFRFPVVNLADGVILMGLWLMFHQFVRNPHAPDSL